VLAEPERTPYDLRFRLLRFPVRIHPWFWIGAVLLGASTIHEGLHYLAMWVGVVLVSILVHEMGHALAFRLFGADSEIVLYAFGGLAVPTSHVTGRWRRVFIALAGPFAGFALCGIVYGTNQAFRWGMDADGLAPNGPELRFLYWQLFWVNLYWGILNLLPVYPLDGGQVCHELCGMKWGTRGKRISLQISITVAVLIVAYSVVCEMDRRGVGAGVTTELPWWFPRGGIYIGILFALLAYTSYQLLQRIEWTDTHWDDRVPWER
jgi:Zn-dependent protease